MANIEISTLTRNNDGNTYIIKDANAIPKSGSSAISGDLIPATDNTVSLGSINNHIKNIYCTEIRGSDSNCCTVCGGSAWVKGAGISLRGKDYSGESGEFVLVAVNDTNMSDLRGKPNGTLTWNGKNIDCVEEQGNGYIRYTNGLQICWGEYSKTTGTTLAINFPKAFITGGDHPLSVSVSGQSQIIYVIGWGSTKVTIGNTNAGAFTYTAVGTWK